MRESAAAHKAAQQRTAVLGHQRAKTAFASGRRLERPRFMRFGGLSEWLLFA